MKNKGYFLFVGDISVRKNIINILKAYSISNLSNDFQLVLAGSMGMGKDLIEKTILDLNLNSRVKILNYVPNNILYSLYINAAGLIFPTYYEGFGIPILEAMKCKIPFLIGNIGAAPETAGGHGIKVSPFSVEEISEGIKSLLETTDFQIETAFKYANKFSWEKNAIETNKLYQGNLAKSGKALTTKEWKETRDPRVSPGFDASTFPHELAFTDENTLVFKPIPWAERLAGSDETNPPPSIFSYDEETKQYSETGNFINATFFYNNSTSIFIS